MKLWLFLESLNPIRWGVRYGKRWAIVKKVDIKIPLKTKLGKNAPHCYLEGEGICERTRDTATFLGHRR